VTHLLRWEPFELAFHFGIFAQDLSQRASARERPRSVKNRQCFEVRAVSRRL